MDRQGIFDYIRKKYEVLPEYPWRRYDDNAVFRHADNKKWFALLMSVQRNRMGLSGAESADVINLKMDDMFFRDQIIQEDGILPAYHMSGGKSLRADRYEFPGDGIREEEGENPSAERVDYSGQSEIL